MIIGLNHWEIMVFIFLILLFVYTLVRYKGLRFGQRKSTNLSLNDDLQVDPLMDNAAGLEKRLRPEDDTDIIGEVRISSQPSVSSQTKLDDDFKNMQLEKTESNALKLAQTKPRHTEKSGLDNHLIVLYVMAKPDRFFSGYDLHQALAAAGLSYGDMGIFHRYAEKNEKTQHILFSVASATKPGYIPLQSIGNFQTKGLTLFMDYMKQKTASAVFQLMLNTAKSLIDDLDGELKDVHKQSWGIEAEQACRKIIQQGTRQLYGKYN